MAKKDNSIYDIVQGLHQAAANAYDGALGEDESPTKTGALRREQGDVLIDQRVMDGFNVKIYGDMMCLTYQSDIRLKEVYGNGFEGEVDQRLTDIVSWIKKEYKKLTGNSVTLTEEGEVDVMVQSTSRIRTWVQAKKHYKIGGISEEANLETGSKDRVEESWRSFLDLGGWKGKRPDNDTRPKNSGE